MRMKFSRRLDVSPASERVLADARRRGFRLAILGRTIAIAALSFAFLAGYHFPTNIAIWLATLALALSGLLVLKTSGTRFEHAFRYVFFAVDAALVAALLAFAPLSSGDDIPQNLVFLTAWTQFFYIVIAQSILTLTPALVLWTGACCAVGLVLSTAWIAAGMQTIINFQDLPIAPSAETFNRIVLNPNFLRVESRIEEVLIMLSVTGIAAIAVNGVRSFVLARVSADERRRQTQRVFGKYVPTSVIAELETDGQLSPRSRDATLLYADVEGFTGISERLQPPEVIALLNELFAVVSEKVSSNGGLVVNYFGDAVIAAFNAPLPLDHHALHAVRAAQQILAALETETFLGHRLRLRIGIASGPVAAGTVGSDERLSFTLYGDTVNLSQRLEVLNKELGTRCLISSDTFSAVRHEIAGIQSVGFHMLRNKQHAIEAYALPAPHQ